MRVIQPKSVGEQLLYSTVRIFNESSSGTGFFYKKSVPESSDIELIITNKHVVEGQKNLQFYLHEGNIKEGIFEPTDKSILFNITDYSRIWIPHPDEDVDLGALLFCPIRTQIKNEMKKDIFAIFLDENLIKDDETLRLESDVTDEVLMIGYPIGLWDSLNNFPLIRKGITASHPALDFNGKSQGIVDIACFPGSSGSPILIYMNGYNDKKGSYLIGACKTVLLGILSSGPVYKEDGCIEIKEIPTALTPVISTNRMIHPTFRTNVEDFYS